jgi:glucosamine--fructose-6-phosphate aminotransferase (isomerizing)
MCGIFGIISESKIEKKNLALLVDNARQRGKDSSGFIEFEGLNYSLKRFDYDLKKSIKFHNNNSSIIIGHSRLVTNSMVDNQPLIKNKVSVIHNGIITNFEELFKEYSLNQEMQIDTEIIIELINYFQKKNYNYEKIISSLLSTIKGSASCVISFFEDGKVILFSNNGSLYYGKKKKNIFISSESYPLRLLKCDKIVQVNDNPVIFDIPISKRKILIQDSKIERKNLVPSIASSIYEDRLLIYSKNLNQRCTKCILPNNFPFIEFNEAGVCNFCTNYRKKYQNFDQEKSKLDFKNILEKYKKKEEDPKLIFPLSGGRDSCYGLHIVAKELKLKPITFTYDWGLVTDLARRNISRISSILNVENIIVADNIEKKRNYIKKNVSAWLNKPHLGMINLFTAGDKHFYRFLEKVKSQNKIDLNIWSYNPFEITHFKHGFLGVAPNFLNKKTYNQGFFSQIDYQFKRLKVMLGNFEYFNISIFDTLFGEYHRSIKKHHDYFYLFNYFKWDEKKINYTLLNDYEWEKSPDTDSTWRIGDGAAPFYNYIYHTFVGFTEFDTFRSNQIREGDISRDEALRLIEIENRPRYQSIKWFLDVIGLDYVNTIKKINESSIKDYR